MNITGKTLAALLLATVVMVASAQDESLLREVERIATVSNEQLYDEASRHVNNDRLDSAFVCFSVIADRPIARDASDDDLRIRTSALGSLGYLYMNYYLDPFKAYKLLLEARDLAVAHNFPDLLGVIYINIAFINYYDNILSGDMPDDFVLHSQQAFDCLYDNGDTDCLIVAMANLIELSIESRDTACIGDRIEKFRSVSLPDSTPLRGFISKACDGVEAYMRGELISAAECFIDAADAVDVSVNPEQGIITALSCAADIYTYARRYTEAEATLDRAIALVKDRETRVHALPLYNRMSRLCQLTGDTAKMRDYTFRYLALKDTLINHYQIGGSHDAQFLYDFNKANEQVKQMQQRHRYQSIVLGAVGVVAVVTAVLLFSLFRLYRRNKDNYHIIYNSYQELLAREEENKRTGGGSATTISHGGKYKNSTLSDDDTKELLARITAILETSPEIYDTDFSIDRLTSLVGAKQSRYVSEAINKETGQNFNTLLNRYRIMKACRMIDNIEENGKYTIEHISQQVGFRSRSAFSIVFKSVTGLTPSVYQSIAKERRN